MADPVTIDTRGSDFAQLVRKITEAGLLDRRPVYYTVRICLAAAAYLGGWALFVWVGDSWWQLLVAVLMGVIFTQFGFLGHDLGHRQVFRTRRPSDNLGLVVGNLCIGLGWGWWNTKHNRHHANPNHEDHDPDVSPAVIVWSTDQARRSNGLPRFIAKWQAFWFFPLLTLEGWHLHVASFKSLANPSMKRRRLEGAMLVAHVVAYLALVFTVLPVGLGVLFLLVHQGVFGLYLGSTFAPNHKGMPILTKDDKLDFLRKQVLTSRNVKGGHVLDVALGQLNYQIEHHLFPNMPAPNLRKAQPIVQRYCEEIGVSYLETGLFDSYGQALRHLHEVGAPLR
ncbi:fatty acid desaturase family protein [Nonomuraea cavernae]|uniref:Delta fatty acid desaturase n=1 Tax=Nonomuraea cavernae TaxID=2045107 RepID=A0A917ZHE7_9ACTN|nr:acyl-CoA desaturase [Nonomuraea cavernae]MCA2190936.1 acyl-CoA desaturase [Nonomuraea cavernae]GGO83298.1 delta fatty acid desaturase [Nonomuraea cavernae]